MTPTIRFTASHIDQVQAALASDLSTENGCFAYCTQAVGTNGPILIVQELRFLADDDYAIRRFDQLSIKPATMLSVARAAARGNRSICMIHIHPMSRGEVHFSMADDYGDARTHPFFARMVPDVPHVSLVFDALVEAVDGRASGLEEGWQAVRTEVCGSLGRLSHRSGGSVVSSPERFDRQQMLIGEKGQSRLADCSIVVVGGGGLGSLVSAGMVHSGVGSVFTVDADHVDETSLHRVLGATAEDANRQTTKVDIAARYAKRLSPKHDFTVFDGPIEDPRIVPRLVSADAIICCTDTMRSRAYLNQICYQYAVPLLDLGCQFQVDRESQRLVNEIGKINLVTPESACLICSGHVRPDILYVESLSAAERDELAKRGYIRGLAGSEPSMQMYNMQVAGLGMQRLLNHLLGIQSMSPATYERLSFLGIGGRPYWSRVAKHRDPECVICGAQSLVRGAGDSQSMLFRYIDPQRRYG